MTLELMRQDPAWKLAWWMAAASAVLWPLLPFHSPASAIAPAGGILLACLARARPQERATLFQAALPVAARQLFLARLLSLLCMVWLPLLAGAFTISLVRTSEMPAAMLVWAAMFSLPVLILQAARIRETAAPRWLLFAVAAIGLPACAAAALSIPAGTLLALSGLVFAAIFALAWRAIPPSFQVATLDAKWVRAASHGRRFQPAAWWPMVRSTLTPLMLIYIPLILLESMTGQWILAACFSMVLLGQAHQGTRWLYGLPVSHRTRLRIHLAPALLPLVIGALLGANTAFWPFAPPRLVSTGGAQFAGGPEEPYRPGTPNVQVPLEFWRHAAGGRAPEIRAPWGESVRPATIRVLGAAFYNPYETARGNSQQFMEWQFDRATGEIYGRPIGPRQLGRGMPSVMSTARLQILELAAILMIVLAIAGGLEFANGHRMGRLGSKLRNAISIAVLSGPFVLLFAYNMWSPVPGLISDHLMPLLLLHLSRALPENLAALAAIAAIPVIAIYLAAERMAAEAELGSAVRQA
jgi:hypothetical protein